MSAGLDLYCTDPAQHLIPAGWDLDDLDRDLSDLSVRGVQETQDFVVKLCTSILSRYDFPDSSSPEIPSLQLFYL